MSVQDGSVLLTPEEAAAWLRVPVGTLTRWRSEGRGPVSVRLGKRVRYAVDDLDAYVRAAREAGATAQAGRADRQSAQNVS